MGINCCSPNKEHKPFRSSIYQTDSAHKVGRVYKDPKADNPVKSKRDLELVISQAKAMDLFATKTLHTKEIHSDLRTSIAPIEIKEEKIERELKLEDSKAILAKGPPEEEKSTHIARGLSSSNSGHICGIDNKTGLCKLHGN